MLILKRCLAFFIDYFIVILYAVALYLVTINIIDISTKATEVSPLKGQVIGLISITLPVFLYFYLMEKSKYKATFGKLVLKLKVNTNDFNNSILIRNLLKFLPWEIAHFGVHWIVYYSNNNQEIPIWVYITLIVPQLIILAYFISIILSNGKFSLYDNIAKTKISL